MADVIDGRKTVAATGTREQLAPSTQIETVAITALSGNTNPVVVGGTTCVAAAGTRRGLALTAGQTVILPGVDDLGKLWLDVVTNGEGVSYLAITGP